MGVFNMSVKDGGNWGEDSEGPLRSIPGSKGTYVKQ